MTDTDEYQVTNYVHEKQFEDMMHNNILSAIHRNHRTDNTNSAVFRDFIDDGLNQVACEMGVTRIHPMVNQPLAKRLNKLIRSKNFNTFKKRMLRLLAWMNEGDRRSCETHQKLILVLGRSWWIK